MYNLYFMQIIEKNMPRYLEHAELVMKLEREIDVLEDEIHDLEEKMNQIQDENSDEYKDIEEKIKDAVTKQNKLGEGIDKCYAPFNHVLNDVEAELKKNKAILEKYKDVEDDKTIDGWKTYLKQHNIKQIELEKKLKAIQRKLDLNNLTKEEIARLDPQAKNEALEARREYLNNKKEYEYYEKLKYVILLGDKTANQRIYETELAIEYLSKQDPELDDYIAPEKMKKYISKLEVLLDIEKQEPLVKFDAKTHTYTYVDARGKETKIDNLFEKQKNGKYESVITEEDINSIKQLAKDKGLTKRQIKAIDNNIVMVLARTNPKLVDNYLEAIKEGKKADFTIEYDLRQEGVEKNEKIASKTMKSIRKAAMKQKAMGLATVIRDKVRLKILGLFTAAGVLALGGATAHTILNEVKDAKINAEKEVDLPEDEKNEDVKTVEHFEGEGIDKKSNEDLSNRLGDKREVNKEHFEGEGIDKKSNEDLSNRLGDKKKGDKESTIEITVPEEDRDEIQNVINEAMKQYYNKEQQTDSKQQKTTKQSKNSGIKKGDKTQEKGDKETAKSEENSDVPIIDDKARGDKEVVIDARGKVTIVDDKEEENGEVIIVDDVEKEDGEVIIVDDGEENVITSDEDMTFKERLQRMAVMEHDLEDYHYENYERAVEESQQRHEEMIEAIEDQIAIDEEEGR